MARSTADLALKSVEIDRMNSFQQWASDHARAHGWTATTCGNWITIHRDGITHECMTAQGLQAILNA